MRNSSADRHQRSGKSPHVWGNSKMAAMTYRDVATGYFREKWAPLKNAAQLVARLAHTSPRTAENWLAGEAAPNGDTLITLMAADPEFAEKIMQLIEDRRCAGRCS